MVRLLKVAGIAAVMLGAVWLLSLPVLGTLLGWVLLVYTIVRAWPAVRADVARLTGGRLSRMLPERPAHAASGNDWRF